MNRCLKWNRALEGIRKYISSKGIKVNKNNFYKEVKIINDFCKKNFIKGSLSDKVLEISKDFEKFKMYINEKDKI